jgi:CO dehydrogenase/acetyl-CoA synthase alpha subunit
MDYLKERWLSKIGKGEPKVKVLKPIAKKTKKRAVLDRKYSKLLKKEAEENNDCEIKSPVCIGIFQGFQHKVKRSAKNLLDRENLLRSCNPCNGWCESNPLKAIAMGVSISKHKIQSNDTN